MALRTVFASSGHAGYLPIPLTPVSLPFMLVVTAGGHAPHAARNATGTTDKAAL
jgi:hypothetical protein